MKPSNDNQSQPESTCENTSDNIEEEKSKSGKSNSELMAEFFAVISDEDKK